MMYDDLIDIICNTFASADYRRKKISLIQKLRRESGNDRFRNISVRELNMFERDPNKLHEAAIHAPQKLIGLFRLFSDVLPNFDGVDIDKLEIVEEQANQVDSDTTGTPDISRLDVLLSSRPAYRINADQYMLYFSVGELVDMVKRGDLIPNIGYREAGKPYGLAYAAIYQNEGAMSYQHQARRILDDDYYYEPLSMVLLREHSIVKYDNDAQLLSWNGTLLTWHQTQVRSLIHAEMLSNSEQCKKINSKICPVVVYYLDRDSFAQLVLQAVPVNENPKLTYMLEKNQAAKILGYLLEENHDLNNKALWLIKDNIRCSYAPFSLTYSFDRSYAPYDDDDINRYGNWLVEFLNYVSESLDNDLLSFLYPELNKSEMFRSLTIMWMVIASRLIYDDVANDLYQDWGSVFRNMLMHFSADTNKVTTLKSMTMRFVTMNRTYDVLAKFMHECREEALKSV